MKITSETTAVDNYNGWNGEQLVKQLGASYVQGRDVKEIAKDVRGVIRKAIKAGYLPAMKSSVKISRFAGGCSLDVTVTEIGETVINVDAWRDMADSNYMKSWVDVGSRYNDRGRDILTFLGRVVAAFQKSESHSQSDYHNTNFYSDVKFDSDIENSQFAELGEAV